MPISMTHTRLVAAPAEDIYRIIADVTLWPVVFGPTVDVRHLARSERSERFQLWAVVGGEVNTWISRRELDPVARTVEFRQERTHPPITAMAGRWSLQPLRDGRTEVRLDHAFSVADAGAEATIRAAVDRNSAEELAALGRIAELGHPVDRVVDTFSDTVLVKGSPEEAYEFIRRSDLWPGRLPHVARVDLVEDAAGVQRMEMDTVTGDGAAHTTRSVRICRGPSEIAYKQLLPPTMLLGHSGRWTFTAVDAGARVTATHTVAIDPAAAREALGGERGLDEVREHLRAALGGNTRATLAKAGAFAAESLH
ncbi:aromatase/cyclase [Phaeacidiphilus oryzae]|uniref:aromatase/cyclase n=1 Tax=Phaeacidiphilus oryzae TaxID=348818 RepID=UPI000567C0A7|nr:aromatase/cyclase [Phaeacidiphilus oryzae]